jgi:hypothetical protein
MNLSDFKLLYTRSEDRLLLVVDTRGRGKLRCWLTRHFTRQWLSDLQCYQNQAYLELEQLPYSGAASPDTAAANDIGAASPDTAAANDIGAATPRQKASGKGNEFWKPAEMLGEDLSDLPVAETAHFEECGKNLSSLINFTDDSQVTLTLPHEAWREVARVIRKADRLADWGLCTDPSGSPLHNDRQSPNFSSSSFQVTPKSRRLH